MPKKFVGENSKAAAARARKDAVRTEEKEKKQKAVEDAYWADDDKNAARKAMKKEEEERKRVEAAKRKEENKKALEEEMIRLQGKSSSSAPSKTTQAAIEARKEAERKMNEEEDLAKKLAAQRLHIPSEHVEAIVNVVEEEIVSARNVDEALAVLGESAGDEVDKHPEKRMKAAYEAFAEFNLPRLKKENPTLRLSQLKQMLRKEWLRSPENPLNAKLKALSS